MKTASEIIEALGGSAVIARETGFPLTTVNSWKASNFIPDWRHDKLLQLGNGKIKPGDFPPETARISRQSAAA